MKTFCKNLIYLRQKHNLSRLELAKKLGVSCSTISNWENEKNIPIYSNFHKISRFFNINADDLIGRESKINTKLNSMNFGEELKKLREIKKLSIDDVSKQCGISKHLYNNFEHNIIHGVDYIRLSKIADLLNTSVENLSSLCNKEVHSGDNINRDIEQFNCD